MKIMGYKQGFFQWDTDQKLILPLYRPGMEIHFANKMTVGEGRNAIVMYPYELKEDFWVVDVPDVILQEPYTLLVYMCSDDATKEEFRFKVTPRPKPDDYVYSETEVLKYSYLEERIEELEKKIESGGTGGGGGTGADGKSAYEIAVENGFEGTEEEWLASLKGEPGEPGADGKDGAPGKDGQDGAPGKDGADGQPGADGYTPVKGVDYYTEAEKQEIVDEVVAKVGTSSGGEVTSLMADKVFFADDLTTTTAIGNIELENGQATIPAKGKNLVEVWNAIYVKESNPTVTQPSVSVTCNEAKGYEVGTEVSVTYSASLNPGSYQYGPETGVTATDWKITDTSGNISVEPTGSFPNVTVIDDMSYKITAEATYGDGATPLTNLGNEYPDGQIKAGSDSATAGAITGFRNSFYGSMAEKTDVNSAAIRKLTAKVLSNGSTFKVSIPEGAMRVIVAYPATLRDVTSIKDVNGLNAEISSGFTQSTVAVEGANGYTAIDYKVYTMDFAKANDTANTFSVTI